MSWYLSADIQLHILVYVVIYFYYQRPLLSHVYIILMILLGFLIPILIVLTGLIGAPNPSIFLHPQYKSVSRKSSLHSINLFVELQISNRQGSRVHIWPIQSLHSIFWWRFTWSDLSSKRCGNNQNSPGMMSSSRSGKSTQTPSTHITQVRLGREKGYLRLGRGVSSRQVFGKITCKHKPKA